jgi:hypothetical protein
MYASTTCFELYLTFVSTVSLFFCTKWLGSTISGAERHTLVSVRNISEAGHVSSIIRFN